MRTSCARRSTRCSILAKLLSRQPGRQPHATSRSTSRGPSTRRAGPADAHQRHPRYLEDRGGTMTSTSRVTFRELTTTWSATSARWRRTSSSTSTSSSRRTLPPTILTDPQRLQQVLKNLLANAFKFTEHGGVSLRIDAGHGRLDAGARDARSRRGVIAFSVSDTGIGIPGDKQGIIFESFQQADGVDDAEVRRHGPRLVDQPRDRAPPRRRDPGVERAGGGVDVHAVLPGSYVAPRRGASRYRASVRPALSAGERRPRRRCAASRARARGEPPPLHRSAERAGRALVIVEQRSPTIATRSSRATARCSSIEDDVNFARILLDMAREKGFKGIVATRGESGAGAREALSSPTRSRSTSRCRTWKGGRCSIA